MIVIDGDTIKTLSFGANKLNINFINIHGQVFN